jgi:hypothetical protein
MTCIGLKVTGMNVNRERPEYDEYGRRWQVIPQEEWSGYQSSEDRSWQRDGVERVR